MELDLKHNFSHYKYQKGMERVLVMLNTGLDGLTDDIVDETSSMSYSNLPRCNCGNRNQFHQYVCYRLGACRIEYLPRCNCGNGSRESVPSVCLTVIDLSVIDKILALKHRKSFRHVLVLLYIHSLI